jgi:hypothetical protein
MEVAGMEFEGQFEGMEIELVRGPAGASMWKRS